MNFSPSKPSSNTRFATTRWTVVVAAGHRSPSADEALAQLCQTYWPPLYAYLRHQGHRPAEAEDLVQGFFARLMEKSALTAADPDRGRFRSFLITSLKNFVANRRDYDLAQKRGGNLRTLHLDVVTAEETYHRAVADNVTADRIFDRQWALDLLNVALKRLRGEYESAGKAKLFEHLSRYLNHDGETISTAQTAVALKISIDAVKMATSRLRRRYRLVLREAIADTVASPEEIDDEIHQLFDALATSP